MASTFTVTAEELAPGTVCVSVNGELVLTHTELPRKNGDSPPEWHSHYHTDAMGKKLLAEGGLDLWMREDAERRIAAWPGPAPQQLDLVDDGGDTA